MPHNEKEAAELIRKGYVYNGPSAIITKDGIVPMQKGAQPGHPFYGNQHTDGEGGGGGGGEGGGKPADIPRGGPSGRESKTTSTPSKEKAAKEISAMENMVRDLSGKKDAESKAQHAKYTRVLAGMKAAYDKTHGSTSLPEKAK